MARDCFGEPFFTVATTRTSAFAPSRLPISVVSLVSRHGTNSAPERRASERASSPKEVIERWTSGGSFEWSCARSSARRSVPGSSTRVSDACASTCSEPPPARLRAFARPPARRLTVNVSSEHAAAASTPW